MMSGNYLQCDYCNRIFSRKYNLRTHILNCHINSNCCCEICDETFQSPAGLQKHLNRGHNRFQKGYPECDICGRIFTRKQNINSHMITVHLQGGFPHIECPHCQKQFTTERNLKRHVNQIHNPYVQLPTCAYCFKTFKGKHSLLDHIQANHSEDMRDVAKCHVCNKRYTNNRNLKRHVEMFHGEKSEFKCELCPKVYTSNQSLRRHNRTRHSSNCQTKQVRANRPRFDSDSDYTAQFYSKFHCESCNRYFKEEYFLRQHIKNEHSFKTFYKYCREYLLKQEALKPLCENKLQYCEYCDYIASNQFDLKEHTKNEHNKDQATPTCHVCFKQFYNQQDLNDHKRVCIPPSNVNSCSHCDKLFTDMSSLEFHTRIFHPMVQIPDTSEFLNEETMEQDISCAVYKCAHCERVYYSDRSLKHHIKLKHTTEEAVVCEFCNKICNNKYYLASHIKIVHSSDAVSKCDYCDKMFKSKRNIRRHIEFTHLGMQRYKCIECETLFKEKRSLRKHVRVKHPNSKCFPECHLCHKRFESAKSCKIHLKLVHSYNLNTHPCHLCSVSFTSFECLQTHLQTNHLAEDQIYKCEECNIVFKGQDNFDSHNDIYHNINVIPGVKQKMLPRCVICVKDFSTRKTLKRHIKKFHPQFEVEELANYGSMNKSIVIDCEECLRSFNDDFHYNIYNKLKHLPDSIIFTCKMCTKSHNVLEYSIHRYRLMNFDASKSKVILSDLCTAEMSEDSNEGDYEYGFHNIFDIKEEAMEPESTTCEIKTEPLDSGGVVQVKTEPASP